MFETAQEFLNHLIEVSDKGGFPSAVNGKCKYRGLHGRRCPVGFLIPDELYVAEMDESNDGLGEAAGELFGNEFKVPLPKWAVRPYLIEDVQNAHDATVLPGDGWSHTEFVHRLKKCPVFYGCRFPSGAE